MSNSAAKKARRRSNLFEPDYEDLLYVSDLSPIKSKNIEKPDKPKKQKREKKETKDSSNTSNALSSVLVPCTCNKCNTPTQGTLIGIIFTPISGLNTPFVSYECSYCHHSGKRSVAAKALPTAEFDRIYF